MATSTHWRLRLLSRALIRRRTELLRYIFSFFEGSCLLSSNLLRDLFLLDPYLLALSVPSLRCFLFLRLFKRESVQGRALLGNVAHFSPAHIFGDRGSVQDPYNVPDNPIYSA